MRKMLWIGGSVALGLVACQDNGAPNAGGPSNDTTVHNTSGQVETATPLANAQGNNGAKPADPIATAMNHEQVTQYPDDVVMAPQPAKLVTGEVTFVRDTFTGNREDQQITSIPTGVTVNEVARRGDYYLILYPSANDATKTMAGWVYKDALESAGWPMITPNKSAGSSATADSKAKTASADSNTKIATTDTSKLSCKSGDLLQTDQSFCAKECKKDNDCSSKQGSVCDGVAHEIKGNKVKTSVVRYCVGASDDVSAPATKS